MMTDSAFRLCVAPMLDWTDRHFRFLARQITRHARLYTEMVNVNALLHGDRAALLDYSAVEHPLALQLGGSEPEKLAQCTRFAEMAGYDEVNLNCGCPSEKVQKGAFGACLMREIPLVARCLNAMADAADIPVSVKHRIGIDQDEDYAVVRDFVGTLAEKTPCRIFIVHARNAWLKGLSPKENREIPPLRYDFAYRLKRDFPNLTIVLNGGVRSSDEAAAHLAHCDGVMVGRAAYENPMVMRDWDARFYGDTRPPAEPSALAEILTQYAQRCLKENPAFHVRHIARHTLGLMHGIPGARRWRQTLSDAALLQQNRAEIFRQALTAMQR